MLRPGSHIGRYEVERHLGRGDVGTVYLAHDHVVGRMVAIKVFLRDLDMPGAAERFARQARSATVLNHANIVVVYDYGEFESQPFIVMEYVEGDTLADMIRRRAPVPISEKLRWIEDLCASVAYAHGIGVIHGDIKPTNLIVDRSNRLKVLDFGIARMEGTRVRNPTTLIETPGYMAPEQILGGTLDHQSDQFSIGVVLYELLSLAEAFPGETAQAITHAILFGDPVPLGQLVRDVHPELVTLVERSLKKSAKDRYSDADVFRTAINHVRRQLESDPHGPRSLPLGTESASCQIPPDDVRLRPTFPTEEVQLTVYRPTAVRPGVWHPMLAFVHLADRHPDAPADAPTPIDQVRSQAVRALGGDVAKFRDSTVDSRHSVPREGEITLVPTAEGIEFNPDRRTFRWLKDVHEERFELRANAALDGNVARGHCAAYLGVLLLAELDLAIRVDSELVTRNAVEESEQVTAKAYRKIFASYSHRDVEIVRQFELFVETLGDSYLRDVRHLRAGEDWDIALQRLIDRADVFQLFWSSNAMRSPHVRREWEYALALNRPAFVRPTYWEDPLPQAIDEDLPPGALRKLYFHRLVRPSTTTSDAMRAKVERDGLESPPVMTLILELSLAQGAKPGVRRQEFGEQGGIIGRANESSWVLPHSKVSGRHAVISCRNAIFYIEDMSRNGVCINSPDSRLVRGRPYALKSGDQILIDPYEIHVSIAVEPHEAARRPLVDSSDVRSPCGSFGGSIPFGGDDPFAQRGVSPLDSSMVSPFSEARGGEELDPLKLLDPSPRLAPMRDAPGAKDLERGSLLDEQYQPPAVVPASLPGRDAAQIPLGYDPLAPDDSVVISPAPLSAPPPVERVANRSSDARPDASPPISAGRAISGAVNPTPVPQTATDATSDAVSAPDLAAILAGAGLVGVPVTPELACNLGRILRVVVSGVMDVWQARQQTNKEFRMDMTHFRPADNNPLEFSANVDEALHNLFVKRNAAYLAPVEAFADAFEDLRNHQIAMLAAMRVAFESMLAEFDPDRLQDQFDRQPSRGALLRVPAPLQYWDLYRDKCREMVKDLEASFRNLFGEEFARVYEEQLQRLRAESEGQKR